MYQFNYRDRRIAWGPLSGTLAAFRGFPGGLPPSARPFTSLIESLPMYTVPLWGGGRNSAIRFCQGGMSLHAETPLVGGKSDIINSSEKSVEQNSGLVIEQIRVSELAAKKIEI